MALSPKLVVVVFQSMEACDEGRKVDQKGEAHILREPESAYNVNFEGEMDALRAENTVYFDINEGESIC